MGNKQLFYYYTHTNYAIEAILKEQLKLSHLHLANDPFELNWFTKDNTEMRDYESIKKGMLCFSKNYSSPLMWGHYSENHQGICLGFEIDNKQLKKVEYLPYKKELKSVEIIDDIVTPNEIINLPEVPIVTFDKVYKSKAWEYEEEHRMYVEYKKSIQVNNDLYFIPFDKVKIKLKEVILGLRCPINYVNIFRSIENKYSYKVKLYNTKVSESEFKVEKDKQIDLEFVNSFYYNNHNKSLI